MTVFLRMLYLRTEQDLLKELNRLRENGFVEYGTYASLMRVQAILQEMQDESFQYVPQAINKVFNETNKRLGYKAAEALSVPQTAIAEQLAGNLLGNINEAAETAYRTSERIMQIGRLHPDAFRNPTIEASLFREAGGVGQTAVEKALKTFNTQNVTSFVDKSGREWGLTEYCTMATRTVSKQAVVAAELTADDWDLWKISPNGTTCALCAAYEGRVYSKSGTNPDYPPLSMAFGKIDAAGGDDLSNTYLNIHPSCLHSLVKYTTAGRTEKEIQRDKDFSSFEKRPANVDYRTKRQIKEYREKEKTRAEFLETRRQWNEYRERLGDKIPSLETFEKHKKAGDDKYKEWMKAYRAKGAEIRKSLPKPEPIPVEPKKTTAEWRQEYEKAKADRSRITVQLAEKEQIIRSAENQNRDLQRRIDDYPDSRYAQQYRQRIALNERTIQDVQAQADVLRMEQTRVTAAQFKAEDELVKGFLSGAKKIEKPGLTEAIKNANPNYDRSRTAGFKPYNQNCQRCIYVYEARRRGYDVEALPSFVGDKWPKGYNFFQFLQGGEGIKPIATASTSKKFKANIEEQMRQYGDGSRAVVRVGWKGRNFGHVFIAEQENGRTRFIDPQSGSEDVTWYFGNISPSKSYMFRVDDKKFSPNIEEAFKVVKP